MDENHKARAFLGDPFPRRQVKTTLGTFELPDIFKGQWFILFSHPGDFTPVCTTEFVAFQQLQPEFARRNTQLIGLSVDQVQSHLKWIEWIRDRLGVRITFPVIADSMGHLASELGMLHPVTGSRTVRSVYIVDPRGVIRSILTYPESVGRNIHEILRIVQALQAGEASQGVTPANWPHNQLIGSDVIVPPAGTVQQIQEREAAAKQGRITCYDWWFCHKPLVDHK